MKYLLTFFLFCASHCHALMSSAGFESEHFYAEFWQKADGKYCVKVISLDDPESPNNHIFLFSDLQHAEECPCDINKMYRNSSSLSD